MGHFESTDFMVDILGDWVLEINPGMQILKLNIWTRLLPGAGSLSASQQTGPFHGAISHTSIWEGKTLVKPQGLEGLRWELFAYLDPPFPFIPLANIHWALTMCWGLSSTYLEIYSRVFSKSLSWGRLSSHVHSAQRESSLGQLPGLVPAPVFSPKPTVAFLPYTQFPNLQPPGEWH